MTAHFICWVPPRASTSPRLKFGGIQRKSPTLKDWEPCSTSPLASSSKPHWGQSCSRRGAVWAGSAGGWKRSALSAIHDGAPVRCSALQLKVCWLGSLTAYGSLHPLIAWDQCDSPLVNNTPCISYQQAPGKQDFRGRKTQSMPRKRIQPHGKAIGLCSTPW